MARDRRPVRANSKATGELPVVPADPTKAKCDHCGKTKPLAQMAPDRPRAWPCCLECLPKTLDTSDKHKNPGAW